MLILSRKRWLAMVALLLLGAGFAMAQSEPTLNQVYEAARAGKFDQAQVMMQQVLVTHPNSAKAHFVQAELLARLGQMDRAREELAIAEKFAPGLPFAKAEAVQKLRTQLSTRASNVSTHTVVPAAAATPAVPATSAPFPWGWVLLLGAGGLALVVFLSRNKAQTPTYAQDNGLAGPQTFGSGVGAVQGYGTASGYGQSGYRPAGYEQSGTGSGLGSRLMGGLATGLAVGAGVMAAQAIGRTFMHDDSPSGAPGSNLNPGAEPATNGYDMGGSSFGVADSGSWDDPGGAVSGDWDD